MKTIDAANAPFRAWSNHFGGGSLNRRDLIAGMGVVAGTGFSAAKAQKPAKLPTIGFIGADTRSGWRSWTEAFVQRMNELGWIEGKTVQVKYEWANGNGDRELEIANEFVKQKVDVLVTVGGASAKQATSDIPIVFAISSDPLGTGLITGLARPGGNITGLSIQSTDLAGKRLELLRELLPAARITNKSNVVGCSTGSSAGFVPCKILST